MQSAIRRRNDSFFHCSLRKLIKTTGSARMANVQANPYVGTKPLPHAEMKKGAPVSRSRPLAAWRRIRSAYRPALLRRSATLSVASQLNSGSERPKWP